MRCLELPVRVHKYFEPDYEIQVPHVHYFKVWLKPFAFYIRRIQKLVSDHLSEIIISETQLTNKRCSIPTNITRRKWARELIDKPVVAHLDKFSY